MAVNNDRITLGGDMLIFYTSGTTYKPLGFSSSSSINITMNPVPIISRDSGDWEDFVSGKFSWDGSDDCIYNVYSGGTENSGSTGVDEMYDFFINKKVLTIKFGVKTSNSVSPNWVLDSAKKYYQGNIMITNMKIDSKDGEPVATSFSFKGKGALSKV